MSFSATLLILTRRAVAVTKMFAARVARSSCFCIFHFGGLSLRRCNCCRRDLVVSCSHRFVLEDFHAWLRFGLSSLAVPVPIAAPFVFLSGICCQATEIHHRLSRSIQRAASPANICHGAVVICVLFFTLSMLYRHCKALPCRLQCILFAAMQTQRTKRRASRRFPHRLRRLRRLSETPPPQSFGCSEMPLRQFALRAELCQADRHARAA